MEDAFDLHEPLPDIHALYLLYNELYFADELGACSVHWSSARMTLCAGVCEFSRSGGCKIKLSEPLLKFRPTRDLKETLLHEMVHAWIFLAGIKDGDHGPRFQQKVADINASTLPDPQRPPGGYRVSTYHNFIAEVDHFRTHHWKCDRCSHLVKRAMNRPPQPADCRGRSGVGEACRDVQCAYHMHVRFCGGTFVKVAEPEGFGQKKSKAKVPVERPNKPPRAQGIPAITDFFSRIGDPHAATQSNAGGSRSPAGAPPVRPTLPDAAPIATLPTATTPQSNVLLPGKDGGKPSSSTKPKTVPPLDFLRSRGEPNAADTSLPVQAGQATGVEQENRRGNAAGEARLGGQATGTKREASRSPERDRQVLVDPGGGSCSPAGDGRATGDAGRGALSREGLRAQLAEAAMKRLKGQYGEQQPEGMSARGVDADPNAPQSTGEPAGMQTGSSFSADERIPAPQSVRTPAEELLMAHLGGPGWSPPVASPDTLNIRVDLTTPRPSIASREESDTRGLDGRGKAGADPTEGMAKEVIELLSSDDD